ncbi:hypothetical protein [Streptomyces sp. NPDC005970]|uniref:hypothetical protein n=1 Tax=Streptomyces sp. NPDC005970 TaxID=3156723 RepID=UPI0033CAB63D
MTGLLWTSVQSRQGARGVAAYVLFGDVYMPSVAVVLPYGQRVKPIADRRAVFFNLLQEFWLLVR